MEKRKKRQSISRHISLIIRQEEKTKQREREKKTKDEIKGNLKEEK